MKEKVIDLSEAQIVHEARCSNDENITSSKLISMNDKVLEIRQLVGVDALSKGLASLKLINDMRRNAYIDENGFMIHMDEPEKRIRKYLLIIP